MQSTQCGSQKIKYEDKNCKIDKSTIHTRTTSSGTNSHQTKLFKYVKNWLQFFLFVKQQMSKILSTNSTHSFYIYDRPLIKINLMSNFYA